MVKARFDLGNRRSIRLSYGTGAFRLWQAASRLPFIRANDGSLASFRPRSGVEFTRRRALVPRIRSTERAEHAVQRRVTDAEPVLLADEVMAQMILLDPAP